jgi:hypothetical protein
MYAGSHAGENRLSYLYLFEGAISSVIMSVRLIIENSGKMVSSEKLFAS